MVAMTPREQLEAVVAKWDGLSKFGLMTGYKAVLTELQPILDAMKEQEETSKELGPASQGHYQRTAHPAHLAAPWNCGAPENVQSFQWRKPNLNGVYEGLPNDVRGDEAMKHEPMTQQEVRHIERERQPQLLGTRAAMFFSLRDRLKKEKRARRNP